MSKWKKLGAGLFGLALAWLWLPPLHAQLGRWSTEAATGSTDPLVVQAPRIDQVIWSMCEAIPGLVSPASASSAQEVDDDDAVTVDGADAADGLDAAVAVPARGETGSVVSDADDPAIWVHPADPAQSLVIGTDKSHGLFTWNLNGSQVQYIPGGLPNNVDVRYGFPLGGQTVDIVATGNEQGDRIEVYGVDPFSRQLVGISGGGIATGVDGVYGFCLYRSPLSAKTYAFVNDKDGVVEQWELNGASGQVQGNMVRRFDVGTQTEGCVADDQTGDFFIGEENVGIWKYGAEPADGSARVQVDAVGGDLVADVEGLTIYYGPGQSGYLIASSQGNDSYAVYDRQAPHAYIGSFEIAAANGVDSVDGADGIDVTNVPLGGAYAEGLFVSHDDGNDRGANNYKLVAWADVAKAFNPALMIDPNSYDPRGGTGALPPPPQQATPTSLPPGPPPQATSTPNGQGGTEMNLGLGEAALLRCSGGDIKVMAQSSGEIEVMCVLAAVATPTAQGANPPTATRTSPPPPASTPTPNNAAPPGPGQDPPNGSGPLDPRKIPIELQAWWAPNFGHIHAAAMLPLGQEVSGRLDFDVRIVLHDNPSHLFELRIDTDTGVFLKIPLNLRCPYDGKTSTNCAFNVPVSLDTTKMKNGWREIRIRATADTPDGNRYLNSSGIPLKIVNGSGGGGDYNRWCSNRSLIGRGWYDGFGYTNAIIECVPLTKVSGVHTFRVRAQKDSGHLQVALDKSHYIPAVGSWHEVLPSAGQIIFDRDGNFQDWVSIPVDTTKLANGWHSLAVTSTGSRGGASRCDFCRGEENLPAGVAKIWFYVDN